MNETRLTTFMEAYQHYDAKEQLKLQSTNFDGSILPTCVVELRQQILRKIYISSVWCNAHFPHPTLLCPSDCGWKEDDNKLEFCWFEGDQLPTSISDVIIEDIAETEDAASLMPTMEKSTKFSDTNRPKVIVTSSTVPQIALDLLGQYCDVIKVEHDTREEIISKVKGVDALFWATKVKLDKQVLDAAGCQMKTVVTMSAGYDHIDVDELKKRGIKLSNTPKVMDDAVADIAVLLALAASRRIHEGRLKIEKSEWSPNFNFQWLLGQDIVGSTVGIIGLGGIGQAIVKRLKGFSVKEFLYTGHREKEEGKELGAKFVSLDTLAKDSDFVIASCPLNSETKHIFNADLFGKMKKTAVFVNISRGDIVDQNALVQALKEGQIFAAGLDVMTPEPLPATDELLKLPNAVIIPHLGSATRETRNGMAQLTAQNILRGLGDEEMFTPVV